MLLVEEDVFRAPASDQIPSVDCGGFASANGGGGASSGSHVWQPKTGQLAEQLRPFVESLRGARNKQEAASLAAAEGRGDDGPAALRTSMEMEPVAQPSHADGMADEAATKADVQGVLKCFTSHISSMLDAISAEVAATRHAQRLASLQKAPALAPQVSAGRASSLKFLRELAGTQMFAMHCFSAKGKLDQAAPQDLAAANGGKAASAAADHFIEEFVSAAASWGMGLDDPAVDSDSDTLDRAGTPAEEPLPSMESAKSADSEDTDVTEVSDDAVAADAADAALKRTKSLQMMV